MQKSRMEAFSDGVLAIIITIMVLELKIPPQSDFSALREIAPFFFSYILSFVFLAIYWNNHHHMLQAVHRVDGRVLWANMHLLFWLSLVPFATAWMGHSTYSPESVAVYATLLLLCGIAYSILQNTLVRSHGRESAFARALGNDFKGRVSLLCYALAIACSLVQTWVSVGLIIVPALLWLVPDTRMERAVVEERAKRES
ncbi:MAG: DUF1211 domain-containing protein [Fimbriimonadaceae bacterium]|nr:DUF1211 domain-containing protein [Fimbriimonadaceae bacterium]QYK56174.1 MAG: DUF1211 domain-containing protein [Fimbriimonadaceae bacterium]